MKLSIEQYNEIFKNRSITDYTKFNWSGEMPVILTIKEKDITATDFNIDINLKAGKYQIEVVQRNLEITSSTHATIENSIVASFRNTEAGYTIYESSWLTVGNKFVITLAKDCNKLGIYPNNWNEVASMNGLICKDIEVRISEYVENIAATIESASQAFIVSRNDNNYKLHITNGYGGLTTYFATSRTLEYGDYRFSYVINSIEGSGTKKSFKIGIYNQTKSKYIYLAADDAPTNGIITITPENYTANDEIYIWLIYFESDTPDLYVDITNYYVCKIQDNWKCIDAGSIDYRRYFNEDAQKYYYGLASQLPERKPNNNVYIQSYNKVDSWPDFWNNTEVYFIAGTYIYLRNDSITTEEALKTSLSGKIFMYEKQ